MHPEFASSMSPNCAKGTEKVVVKKTFIEVGHACMVLGAWWVISHHFRW